MVDAVVSDQPAHDNHLLTALAIDGKTVVPWRLKESLKTFLAELASQERDQATTENDEGPAGSLSHQRVQAKARTLLLKKNYQRLAHSKLLRPFWYQQLSVQWASDDPKWPDYQILLEALGSNLVDLHAMDEQIPQIKKVLAALLSFKKIFPQSSRQTLIYYAQVYGEAEGLEPNALEALISISMRRSNDRLTHWVNRNAYLYAALTVFGFVTAVLSLGHMVTLPQTVSDLFSEVWNSSDSVEGFVEVEQLQQQNKPGLALLGFLGTTQMVLSTLLVGTYQILTAAGEAVLPFTPLICDSLLGFGFALSYVGCWALDYVKMGQMQARIDGLESKIKTNDCPQGVSLEDLQRDLVIAQAQYLDSKRSCEAYGYCAVAMMAVAVVTVVALSGVTFGALPAAMVVAAAIAVASASFRTWWVHRTSNQQLAAEALKPLPCETNSHAMASQHTPTASLHQRWQAIKRQLNDNAGRFLGVDFHQPVKLSFFHQALSLKDYIDRLQYTKPAKLNALLPCLEQANKEAFTKALQQKSHAWDSRDTEGYRIWAKLTAASSPNPVAGNEACSTTNPLQLKSDAAPHQFPGCGL